MTIIVSDAILLLNLFVQSVLKDILLNKVNVFLNAEMDFTLLNQEIINTLVNNVIKTVMFAMVQ
jgi:hypothetical protein